MSSFVPEKGLLASGRCWIPWEGSWGAGLTFLWDCLISGVKTGAKDLRGLFFATVGTEKRPSLQHIPGFICSRQDWNEQEEGLLNRDNSKILVTKVAKPGSAWRARKSRARKRPYLALWMLEFTFSLYCQLAVMSELDGPLGCCHHPELKFYYSYVISKKCWAGLPDVYLFINYFHRT